MNLSSGFCVLFSALAVTSVVEAAPKVPDFLSSLEVTGHTCSITEVSSDGKIFGGTVVEDGRAFPFRHSAKDGFRVVALISDTPADTEGAWLWGMSDEGGALYGHFQYDEAGTTYLEGFVWTVKGGFQRVGQVDGGEYSVMRTITKNNKVLGGQYLDGGNGRAFVWTPATGIRPCVDVFPGFPATGSTPVWISNSQKMVWTSTYEGGLKSMVWTLGKEPLTFSNLPDLNSLEVLAVNGDGRVGVGSGRSVDGYEAAIFTSEGQVQRLFPEREVQTIAKGVTPGGRLVYGNMDYVKSTSIFDADDAFFVDRKTGSVVTLNAILDEYASAETVGWTDMSLTAVSDNGDVIVGSGTDPQGQPSSWVMRNVAKVLMPKPSKATR